MIELAMVITQRKVRRELRVESELILAPESLDKELIIEELSVPGSAH